MSVLIKKTRIIDPQAGIDLQGDVYVDSERIEISPNNVPNNCLIIAADNYVFVPGLIDLHVHFRDPGFSYKEDIRSGILASWAGGVTSAMVMPNTEPAIDSLSVVDYQFRRARALNFDLLVAASATKGLRGAKLSDVGTLTRAGVRAFTDDGKAILSDAHMEELLFLCRRHDVLCMQHAEDPRISHCAPMHEGHKSKSLGILGQPYTAESSIIARDLRLVERIGARYHALHVSSAESLKLLRRARRNKAAVSCEVSPHHLLLCENDMAYPNSFKKMNPPLRSRLDREALLDGISDGTIDAVASDHAPHSQREKKRSFAEAPFGVVGVETSILVLMSLANAGFCTINRAIELMTSGPARVLHDEQRIGTFVGPRAMKNACLIDPKFRQRIGRKNLFGRSRNSAFIGMELEGRVMTTIQNGHIVYSVKDLF